MQRCGSVRDVGNTAGTQVASYAIRGRNGVLQRKSGCLLSASERVRVIDPAPRSQNWLLRPVNRKHHLSESSYLRSSNGMLPPKNSLKLTVNLDIAGSKTVSDEKREVSPERIG